MENNGILFILACAAADWRLAVNSSLHYLYRRPKVAERRLLCAMGLNAETDENSHILLSWLDAEYGDGYLILRDGKQIGYTQGTSFVDEEPNPHAFNFYWVITYVQASATEIALKWDVAPEGTVYTIFMKKEGGRERVLVKDLTDNFYTVSGLEPDTRYSFRIIARHGLHFLQFPILTRKTKAE